MPLPNIGATVSEVSTQLSRFLGWLLSTGPGLLLLAGLAALFWGLLRPVVIPVYRRLTARARLRTQLRKLACGMQIDYFRYVLRQPPQYVNRPAGDAFVEYIFVFVHAYVQAIADQYGKVGLFAVTTRSARFHPRLSYYPNESGLNIELGRTRLCETGETPAGVNAGLGARRVHYTEWYYFGNPGHYQTYALGMNDAGFIKSRHVRWPESRGATVDLAQWLTSSKVYEFRTAVSINTYAVANDWMSQKINQQLNGQWIVPFTVGPNLDQVRTSPTR